MTNSVVDAKRKFYQAQLGSSRSALADLEREYYEQVASSGIAASASSVSVDAATNIVEGDLQTVLESLADRVKALETP